MYARSDMPPRAIRRMCLARWWLCFHRNLGGPPCERLRPASLRLGVDGYLTRALVEAAGAMDVPRLDDHHGRRLVEQQWDVGLARETVLGLSEEAPSRHGVIPIREWRVTSSVA